jgi:hypothetical protein
MDITNIVTSACITVLAFGLLLVSLASYGKYKNMKLFFVSLVFFLFLVKGIILSLNLFFENFIELSSYFGVFDVVMLILLFIATLKR